MRLEDHAFSVRIAAAEAVKWLWRGGAVDAEAIATVYAVATSSSFSDTRAVGCIGLGALGVFAEPHASVIARRLEDDGLDVRTAAAEALSRLGREGAVDARVLSATYASVAGSSLASARASGCAGLGSVGNAVRPYALLLAWKLSDESDDVRAAAKVAVERLGQDEVDADVLARIYAAAASGALAEARVVGCLGLGTLGRAAMPHLPLLHHIMLTDQSSDVQSAARAAAEEVSDAFLADARRLTDQSSDVHSAAKVPAEGVAAAEEAAAEEVAYVDRLAAARRQDLPSNAEYLLVSCPEFDGRGEPVLQHAVEVMEAYGGASATGGVYRAIQVLQDQDPSKVLILVAIEGESEHKFDSLQFELEMPNLAANTRTHHCSDVHDLLDYFESGGLIPDARH